jgi:YVTN family beta-propeller protein
LIEIVGVSTTGRTTRPSRLVCAAVLGVCGVASAQPAPANASVAAHRVYVSNETSGDVTVLDGATLETLATLPLGKRPRGLQLAADGRTLFVALSGSPISPPGVDESTLPPPDKGADGIGVVDVAELRIERVLRGVSDPEQLAVGLDAQTLYIASEDTGTAVIQDAASGARLAELPVGGEPEGVGISPDGALVYVSSETDHRVTAIDTVTRRAVASVEVGKRPRAIAFAPDGRRAYVTGENDASVTVVDTKTHAIVDRVTLTGENVRPMGVAVAPDGAIVYVATGRGGTVVALDAQTLEVRGSVRVGQRPWGIALSPDGRRLYAANGPSNDVTVIDAARLEVVATLPVGQRPWGVVVGPVP